VATVVKTVRIDIGISGDAASKQKLDAITARAEELKKAFPEYKLKIDTLAASQRLAVFRADMKATAAEVSKPIDIQVIGKKAQAALDAIDARALKLKATWPTYTVTIDDKAAKAKMDLLAVESKLVGDKISSNLSGSGGGGLFSKLGGLFGGGGGGGGAAQAAAGGPSLAMLAGIPALAAAAAAAIPVVAAVGTVATGAAVGLGAFGAVAFSTFKDLQAGMTAVSTANDNFGQAAGLVDTAIQTSSADAKLYNAALKSLPPGLASAQKLLGDTGVTWQGLTQSQQNNVVALSQNKDALKNMFPAQKTALGALLASKKAWDDLTPGQQAAAKGLHTISDAWGKLTNAMAPSVLSVIAEAAGFVTRAIKPLGDIAKLAVPGIKDMIGILGNGLIGFLMTVKPLIAPSIGALNTLLVKMSPALQGLVEQMVKGMPQFVKLFGALATIVTVGIEFMSWLVEMSAKIIPQIQGNFHHLANDVDAVRETFIHIGHDAAAIFNGIKDVVVKAFRAATDTFLTFVSNMLHGLLSISTTMGHLPSVLGAPWRAMSGELRTAIGNVGGLKKAVDGLPTHKGVSVSVTGSGSGNITFAQQVAGRNSKGYLQFHAAGGMVGGSGGPTADNQLIAASTGEYVVKAASVARYGPHMMDAINQQRFAAGGLVGPSSVLNTGEPWMGAREASAGYSAATSFGQGILTNMHQLVAAASAAAAAAFTSGPAASGSALAAQNFARGLLPSYGWAAQWPALLNLWNRESGWNANAVNPSSGAYGIPQSLGHGHPYNLGDYANQVRWGLSYIEQRYGGPNQAWFHELSSGWYDQGGYLPTGLSLAYNGTGRPEPVGHGGGNTYNVTVNMPFGSTAAEVRNGLVKALDQLNQAGRLPKSRRG
jgi:hypothetical protein